MHLQYSHDGTGRMANTSGLNQHSQKKKKELKSKPQPFVCIYTQNTKQSKSDFLIPASLQKVN